MEIQLVGLPGDPTYRSIENLLTAAAAFGLTISGAETAPHLNSTLQGLPKFKELAGPMGGEKTAEGGILIRYETWQANKSYST